MAENIIDGIKTAAEIKAEIKTAIEDRVSRGLSIPGLATVLVGENPASKSYVASKIKTCEKLGIRSFSYTMPGDCTQQELDNLVQSLNSNPEIHGILVQLPLPEQLSEEHIMSMIAPQKDVDGLTPYNAGLLSRKFSEPLFYPCTPSGIIHLIHTVSPDISGKQAVVIGRSSIVGMPTLMMLSRCDATPTLCHSKTANLPEICKNADILVSAAGVPGLVKGEWIKEGAIVIDVGINHVSDPDSPKGYRLTGDVEFSSAAARAGAITPVPGGVGPMTIAMLMKNTLKAVEYE